MEGLNISKPKMVKATYSASKIWSVINEGHSNVIKHNPNLDLNEDWYLLIKLRVQEHYDAHGFILWELYRGPGIWNYATEHILWEEATAILEVVRLNKNLKRYADIDKLREIYAKALLRIRLRNDVSSYNDTTGKGIDVARINKRLRAIQTERTKFTKDLEWSMGYQATEEQEQFLKFCIKILVPIAQRYLLEEKVFLKQQLNGKAN
jgi:hypothetical protein